MKRMLSSFSLETWLLVTLNKPLNFSVFFSSSVKKKKPAFTHCEVISVLTLLYLLAHCGFSLWNGALRDRHPGQGRPRGQGQVPPLPTSHSSCSESHTVWATGLPVSRGGRQSPCRPTSALELSAQSRDPCWVGNKASSQNSPDQFWV